MKRRLFPLLAAALVAAASAPAGARLQAAGGASAGARLHTSAGTVFRNSNHVESLTVQGARLVGLTGSGHRWSLGEEDLRRAFHDPSSAPAPEWIPGPATPGGSSPAERGLRWSGQAGGYPVTDRLRYRGRDVRATYGGGLFVGERAVENGPREIYDLEIFAGLLVAAHASGLALYDGFTLVDVRLPGPPDDNVSALAWYRNALYVGFFDAGLARLRDGRWRRIGLPELPGSAWINALLAEGDDLWVGGGFGLGRLDAASDRVVPVPEIPGAILGLRNDDGHLVATGAHAVWVRSNDGWHKTDLPGEALHTAFVHDGELWAAGMRGVLRRRRGGWRRYTELDGSLPHGWVTALLPVEGRLWAGTYDAGLVELAESRPGPILRREAWVNPNAMTVFPGGVAVGTMGDGLLLYESGNRRWRSLTALDGLPSDDVTAVLPVGSDLWVGTRGGLVRLSAP